MSIPRPTTRSSNPATSRAAFLLLVACACAHATPSTPPAVTLAPEAAAFDASALQRGMRYAEFRARAGASGWLPENAPRAGSCAAAGDCEIVFGRARGAERLHVHIGTADGVAVIDGWRLVPRRMGEDPATDTGLTAEAGTRASKGAIDIAVEEPRP